MKSDGARAGMRVSDSATEMAQPVLPQHANVHGSVLGGTVMHWIDLAAAVVANRHSRRPVVTAAIDELSFLAPIQVGQLALLRARITLVDRSSMEIRVDVESEDLLSGERRHTSTAYVTFVALDPVTRRPVPVPPLIVETEDERQEHAAAQERRRRRLEHRKAVQAGAEGTPRTRY
jgi:acyl-CoA hydrolase